MIPGLKQDEEDDEELPPLEQPSTETLGKERNQKQLSKLIDDNSEPSTSEEQSPEKEQDIASEINKQLDIVAKAKNKAETEQSSTPSNLIQYEDEEEENTAAEENDYNDLEELD